MQQIEKREVSAIHLTLFTFFLLTTSLLFASCNTPTTPEEIAAEFIEQSEKAFEERNISLLRKLVSPDYRDSRSRTAGDVVSIATAYIRSSKSIYVFSDLESAVHADDRIQVKVLSAFGARPIMDRTALPKLNADIYWFDILLAKESGDWKLLEAQWRQAMVDDFFREKNNN